MGIKHNLMKNIRTVNLAQLSDDKVFGGSDEPAKEGEQSIADLTSNAKEEIKSSIQNAEKKEEPKKDPEQSSSSDEGEKKEKTEETKQDKSEDESSKDNNQNLAEKEPAKAQNTTTSQEKADENASDAQKEVKVKNIKDPKGAAAGEADDFANEAIMITGATHARELLSSQVPLFICLKLLH
jgi:hypothetical protein